MATSIQREKSWILVLPIVTLCLRKCVDNKVYGAKLAIPEAIFHQQDVKMELIKKHS